MFRRSLPAIALCIWGAALCVWLWERTGDILGDFGNELYVAWQLSQGRVFGRDIAYLYGPLSPCINAMAMRMFGPSLNVILAINLLVLVGVTVLIYDLVRAAASEWAAFTAAAFFLAVFALSSGTRVTNYNFLTPYAHGMTHGLLLCLATVWCLRRWHVNGAIQWAAAAAVLTGLSFLTKPEMFVGCALTFAAGFFIAKRQRTFSGALITIVLFGLALGPIVEWLALRDISAGWQFATPGHVLASPLHVAGLGLDNVGNSLRAIGFSALVDAIAIAILIAVAMKVTNLFAAIFISAAMFAVVAAAGQEYPHYWVDADRALLLLALGALVIFGLRVFAGATDKIDEERRWAQWVLSVLSVSLLLKMFLNVRTYHYGFVLAAPCAMLGVAALIDWLPSAIARGGGSARTARMIAMGLLFGLAVNRLVLTGQILSERTLEIPLALGGILHARPIDTPAVDAVAWLKTLPASASVAVFPDAAGIAFAGGKSSDVRYSVLNPMTVGMWREENALRELEAHQPDFILVVRTDAGELGAHYFGEDYGADVMKWVGDRYDVAENFGQGLRSIQTWKRRK